MATRSLKEERELLLEVNKLRLQLDKPLFTEKGLGSGKKDLENLTAEIRILRAEANDLGDSFEGIYKSLADSVQEFTNMNTVVGDAKKNFKSIKDITEKLVQDAAGNSELSLKDLKNLDAKYKSSKEMLMIGKDVLLTEQERNDSAKEILGFLDKENAIRKSLEDGLKERIKKEEAIENSIGRAGAALKGLSKIPVIGGLVNSEKILKDLRAEAKALDKDLEGSGNKALSMGKILKAFGKEGTASLKDPSVQFGIGMTMGSKAISGLKDNFQSLVKMLDEYNGKLTKTYAISQKEAGEINTKFKAIADSTGNQFINVKGLGDAFNSLNAKGATFAQYTDETLTTFTKFQRQAGISAEALVELNDLTYLNGKSLEDTTKEYSRQIQIQKQKTGLALNEKVIQEDIKNISAATKLQFNGSASALAEAAFKARALGMELKDIEAISSTLLNFQSSIEDELSAELLTGRQLNLEGARYAALIGDQGMLAAELAENIGTAADFTSQNVIQQEALAKAVGMNRNQLAETLMQTEKLNKLSAEGNTLQERYNNLKAEGKTEAEIALLLQDEGLAKQLESAGIQESMNLLVENLQEQFLPLAEKILPMITGALKFMGDHLNSLIALSISLKVAQLAIAAAATIASFATNPIKGGVGLALGIAGVAAGAAAITAVSMGIGDGQFDNSTGDFEISKKEGGLETKRWKPSRNDVIQVMPKEVTTQPSRNTGGNTQAINNNVTVSPSDTKITLNLNGQAIGNANARQAYGVGSNIKALGGGVDYSAAV